MIKNFLFSLSLAIMCILGAHADDYAQEDPFDFDNFAIAEGGMDDAARGSERGAKVGRYQEVDINAAL